ncbi:peptidase C39-like protein [Brevibacillus sp. AG162]|uniref:C39 family peptidase n=1 Tax=Brevibacillus sp. AG162 TaxID=2572910 RepID=UPI0011528912|nr:C39 family peptidase [Brevibacillus sp. AG162]TQK63695.1 peptidase C39-like protein [Brevibacillus sp. AG162]
MVKRFSWLLFVVSLLFFSSGANANEDDTYVSEKVADEIVKDYIKKFKFDVSLEDKQDVVELYDTNDEHIGYYYELENAESYFFIVSANTDYSPVFAAGKGKIKLQELEDDEKYYFLGNTSILKSNDGSRLVKKINKGLQKKEKDIEFTIQKNREAKSIWESYTTEEASDVSTLRVDEEYLNVTRFTQWEDGVNNPASSCGPATIAAIAEYWRSKKGFDTIDGLDYFTRTEMINAIYKYHGGKSYGMSVSNVRSGLKSYINRGHTHTVSTDSFNSFSTYKYEIGRSRPLAVKFDQYFTFFEPDAEYAYDYHWTVGVGYLEDGTDKYLYIQDNGIGYTDGTWDWSKELYIDYTTNKPIITMVSLEVS